MPREHVPENFAPVRRDAGWLNFPKRNTRPAAFVALSVLTLAGPLIGLCLKHRAWFSEPQPTSEREVAQICQHLGRGKEIFTLIAESAIPMPDGYQTFDEAIARISFETTRLQRELKGLAFLSKTLRPTETPTQFTTALSATSTRLLGRMTVEDDLEKLRCLLCSTVREDEPPLSSSPTNAPPSSRPPGQNAPQPSPSSQASFCSRQSCAPLPFTLSQDIAVTKLLTEARQAFINEVPEPTQPNIPISNADSRAPASSTHSASNTIADHYRHLVWKRGEILQLIHDTLHPSGDTLTQNDDSTEAGRDPKLRSLVAHAVALQRVAFGLSCWSVWVSLILAGLVILFWYRMWVGRQYALGRGRWRAQLVVYVFVVLQIYNIVLASAYQPEGLADDEALTEKSEHLRDAYKTATQEIHHRLEQEQHFYILKFTMIGALLAVFFRFLLSTDDEKKGTKSRRRFEPGIKDAIDKLRASKIAAFFFWAAVIINCIIDTRLRYNAVICIALGRWIRTLETSIEEHGLSGWETFFDQQALISSSPLMQIAPTLLTTIVFVLTVVLFIAKERENVTLRGNVSDNLKQVNLVFGGIAFLVIAFSALGQPGMVWEWSGPVLFWVATGMVVLLLGPKALQNRVFRWDEITDPVIGYSFPFHYIDLYNTPPRLSRVNYGWLVRILCYIPIPGVRHRLVAWVMRKLQVQLIYLELSADPFLSQTVRVAPDGSVHADPNVSIWSLLYMEAGPLGVTRVKRGISRNLSEGTLSAELIVHWLESRTSLIRRAHHEGGKPTFEIRDPGEFRASVSSARDSVHYVSCSEVRYCRVFDYYDEHNPWTLLVCELQHEGKDGAPIVLFSFKDIESHVRGIVKASFMSRRGSGAGFDAVN